MAVVSMSNSLTLGASDDLVTYYRTRNKAMVDRQEQLCRVIKTELREVKEPLKESVPFPSLWPLNTPRNFATFKDRLLTYTHYNWNLAIPFNRFDEEDEVVKGDLQSHLASAADRFRQMVDQLMADHILGTATLGQALGLAFDGAALFSATDGDGAARFGVSGGNILTVPLASEADVVRALIKAGKLYTQFKDTASQPFFVQQEIDVGKMILVCGPALYEQAVVARDAKFGNFTPALGSGTENPVFGKFDLWMNPRITGSNAYVMLKSDYYKTFAHIQRKSGPEVQWGDEKNWDRALMNGEKAMFAHTREAVEIFAPHAAIKLTAA